MKFVLTIFLMNLFNCSIQKDDIKKKFYTKSEDSFIELDFSNEENIIGNHCFVFDNGNKIDCCIDDEKSYSLKIKLEDNGVFEGTLVSCYDEYEYDIIIKIEDKNLILSFKNEDYPFISSTLTFSEKE